MKVAHYVRVSREDMTADNQAGPLKAEAERRGDTVVKVYRDDAVSGLKASRPALDAMLRDAEAGRFEAVVVWKIDRLGRSLPNLLEVLRRLEAAGVSFVSMTEGLDLRTPCGRLMFNLLGAVAAFERDMIVERTKAGLERARASGKRLGRPRKVRVAA